MSEVMAPRLRNSELERDLAAILRLSDRPSGSQKRNGLLAILSVAALLSLTVIAAAQDKEWMSAADGVAATRSLQERSTYRQATARPLVEGGSSQSLSNSAVSNASPRAIARFAKPKARRKQEPSAVTIEQEIASAVALEPAIAVSSSAPDTPSEQPEVREVVLMNEDTRTQIRPQATEMSLYEPLTPEVLSVQRATRFEAVDEIRFLRLR